MRIGLYQETLPITGNAIFCGVSEATVNMIASKEWDTAQITPIQKNYLTHYRTVNTPILVGVRFYVHRPLDKDLMQQTLEIYTTRYKNTLTQYEVQPDGVKSKSLDPADPVTFMTKEMGEINSADLFEIVASPEYKRHNSIVGVAIQSGQGFYFQFILDHAHWDLVTSSMFLMEFPQLYKDLYDGNDTLSFDKDKEEIKVQVIKPELKNLTSREQKEKLHYTETLVETLRQNPFTPPVHYESKDICRSATRRAFDHQEAKLLEAYSRGLGVRLTTLLSTIQAFVYAEEFGISNYSALVPGDARKKFGVPFDASGWIVEYGIHQAVIVKEARLAEIAKRMDTNINMQNSAPFLSILDIAEEMDPTLDITSLSTEFNYLDQRKQSDVYSAIQGELFVHQVEGLVAVKWSRTEDGIHATGYYPSSAEGVNYFSRYMQKYGEIAHYLLDTGGYRIQDIRNSGERGVRVHEGVNS